MGLEKEKKPDNEMFEDFIDKIEVVYAVLLAWGFARIAENFQATLGYLSATIISGFVLIRFFFAASHNLKPMAQKSENSPFQQRVLFLWDIPLLIIHSFIYYRMCVVLSRLDYTGFYERFCFLLGANIIWLITINKRFSPAESRTPAWCSKWCLNNSIHIIIIYFLVRFDIGYLLFWVALSNCIFDFILTAPDYLGFRKGSSC